MTVSIVGVSISRVGVSISIVTVSISIVTVSITIVGVYVLHFFSDYNSSPANKSLQKRHQNKHQSPTKPKNSELDGFNAWGSGKKRTAR